MVHCQSPRLCGLEHWQWHGNRRQRFPQTSALYWLFAMPPRGAKCKAPFSTCSVCSVTQPCGRATQTERKTETRSRPRVRGLRLQRPPASLVAAWRPTPDLPLEHRISSLEAASPVSSTHPVVWQVTLGPCRAAYQFLRLCRNPLHCLNVIV